MARPTRDDALLILRAMEQAALNKTPAPMSFTNRKEFSSSYAKFVRDHPPGSVAHEKATKIATYYEGLGTMWKHGLINEDLLFDWMAVHPVWDRMESFVLGSRQAAGEPRLGENFEAMAKASAAWGKKPAARRSASDGAGTGRAVELRGKRATRAKRTRVPARRG